LQKTTHERTVHVRRGKRTRGPSGEEFDRKQTLHKEGTLSIKIVGWHETVFYKVPSNDGLSGRKKTRQHKEKIGKNIKNKMTQKKKKKHHTHHTPHNPKQHQNPARVNGATGSEKTQNKKKAKVSQKKT